MQLTLKIKKNIGLGLIGVQTKCEHDLEEARASEERNILSNHK